MTQRDIRLNESRTIVHTDIKPDNLLLSHPEIEDILKKQLRSELIARLKKEEQERLRSAEIRGPRQPYIPKTPGLSPEQIKAMQDIREKVEAEKWEITPVLPVSSPIGFMKAGKSPARTASSSRTTPNHPGAVREPVVTPDRRSQAPKTAQGISPPPPIDLPDSGFRTAGPSRLVATASNLTLSRRDSRSHNTSPLLARAIAAQDNSPYLHGAPLERYPTRQYMASPLNESEMPRFDQLPPAAISFNNDGPGAFIREVSVQTVATASGGALPLSYPSAKAIPLAGLDTSFCHAKLIPPDADSITSSLIGSQLSGGGITRSSSGSGLGPGSGSGSSQNGDGWLSGSFYSSQRTGGSASSMESSFTADSGLRAFKPSSPTDALRIRWEQDNTPNQPFQTDSFPASSSPMIIKYGIRAATSTSIDAARTQGSSIFRPNVIPHPLLAPYQPLTIEERLRQLAIREDYLAAQAAGKQEPAEAVFDPAVKVKLADLGNALFYADAKASRTLPTHVCTRYYREPGNIIGVEYDLGVDVWALGCTVGLS